jgi:hypothetical protein
MGANELRQERKVEEGHFGVRDIWERTVGKEAEAGSLFPSEQFDGRILGTQQFNPQPDQLGSAN